MSIMEPRHLLCRTVSEFFHGLPDDGLQLLGWDSSGVVQVDLVVVQSWPVPVLLNEVVEFLDGGILFGVGTYVEDLSGELLRVCLEPDPVCSGQVSLSRDF